jgi:hypothetical protein
MVTKGTGKPLATLSWSCNSPLPRHGQNHGLIRSKKRDFSMFQNGGKTLQVLERFGGASRDSGRDISNCARLSTTGTRFDVK